MPRDLTWRQLRVAANLANLVDISEGVLKINVSLLTGETYSSVDDAGVVEFVQKLLTACNKAQSQANEGISTGARLAAFPSANLGVPSRDSDGIIRVTCNQTVISRLPVDLNDVVGVQN